MVCDRQLARDISRAGGTCPDSPSRHAVVPPPYELTAFEVDVFFQFSTEEAWIIEECRRTDLKFGLALQIGFLRMSSKLLDAVRMVACGSPFTSSRTLLAQPVAKLLRHAVIDLLHVAQVDRRSAPP
jgi:hypothetical protein